MERHAEALGEDDLEDVAGSDVLLRRAHAGFELLARRGALEGRVVRGWLAEDQGRGGRAAAQAVHQRLDLCRGGIVAAAEFRLVRALGLHRHDEAGAAEEIVDGEHRPREHEEGVGKVQGGRVRVR